MTRPRAAPGIGLVLTGGGARTAYQVGVLLAINSWLQRPRQSPFAVITGTSAGAINASVLAAHAGSFGRGVEQLASVWRMLEVGHIFHCERRALYGRALRWVWALLRGGLGRHNPRALLDYQPLRDLLERHVNFARIDMQIRRGVLEGVAITASGYGSGRAVTFYQSASEVTAWSRERVQSRPTRLSLDHVMASVAIPLLFEAVRLGDDWYGDGSMRDHTPLSPAINLGARRLLVIATRNSEPATLPQPPPYPQLGKIAGYILDSLFMDGTGSNLERVQRLNELARCAGTGPAAPHDQAWRQIDTCLVKPSQDLRHLATLHAERFPAPVRRLFRGIGAFGDLSPLPSYLLFDGTFCQALMNLGQADAQRQKDEIMAVLAPG